MRKKFVIRGRRRLSGEYLVQGNKNAALPLIAASLLAKSRVELDNVPAIVDVDNLLRILTSSGIALSRKGQQVTIEPSATRIDSLQSPLVEKLRGSILLLGALVPRVESLQLLLPGGCPIGRRSFQSHWDLFRSSGYSVREDRESVTLEKVREVNKPRVDLIESSVTATENALILFASLGGGLINNPAREPHVLTLINFLRLMGCEIELHPLHYKIKTGIDSGAGPISFTLPGDYIEAGTVAIAAAVTGGEVTLNGISENDMMGIEPVLDSFGVKLEWRSDLSTRITSRSLSCPSRVVAGLWPSFPTDLISLAIVLASQSRGLCLVHDWLYESRMYFVDKLVRMGASVTLCDPHRVLVHGPTRLRGARLESPDIRAGMALVVAGLCAEGVTTIELAEVVERGYSSVVKRLRSMGADIREEVSYPETES